MQWELDNIIISIKKKKKDNVQYASLQTAIYKSTQITTKLDSYSKLYN